MRSATRVGTLCLSNLVESVQTNGPATRVAEVMQRGVQALDHNETMDHVFNRFQETRTPVISIPEHGRLIGAVTVEDLVRILTIDTAMARFGGKPCYRAPRR